VNLFASRPAAKLPKKQQSCSEKQLRCSMKAAKLSKEIAKLQGTEEASPLSRQANKFA